METNLLPEGNYTAHASEVVLGKTQTGKPQVAVKCEIETPGFEGRSIVYYGFLTDAALAYAVDSLRAMGWEGNDLSDLSSITPQNKFSLSVEHETYEGKTRAKVKFIGSGAIVKDVMAPDEVRLFAASLKSKIAALSANGATVKTPKAKPETAGGDIPF
jgi:hypothetical protein